MSHWQQLALEFGTDKGTHTYMPVYERFLGPRASDPLLLLEIGVQHGNSLRLWLKLFPHAHVFGLDKDPCPLAHPRVTTIVGRQQDPAMAGSFLPESLDAIIDDGGHFRWLQRDSVQIFWPCLKAGGLYFIEDILTDDYPDEIDSWKADPHYLYSEANRHDIYGKYERADAIVVLRKRGPRPPAPLLSDPATLTNDPSLWRAHP